MGIKQITLMITLLAFVTSATAYARQEVSPPPETVAQGVGGATPEAAPAKEDERLPVQKEEWQFLASPYLWIPGAGINTTLSGHTSSVSEGWYDMVPHLFSNAIGAMGRFEA